MSKLFKISRFILAGSMLIGSCFLSIPVCAEEINETLQETELFDENDLITLSMDNINDEIYLGEWVDFEPGFELFLPDEEGWEEDDITSDEEARGIFYKRSLNGGEAGIAIQANNAGGKGFSDLISELQGFGYTSVQLFDVNGIYAVGFDDPENDLSGLAFLGESGTMYTILCSPVSKTEYQPVFLNVFQSLSPALEMETDWELDDEEDESESWNTDEDTIE